jgi:hypothetical protein
MKYFYLLFAAAIFSCGNHENNQPEKVEYLSYGEEINATGAVSAEEAVMKFSGEDSLLIKLSGIIEEVCQKKGCWLTLALENGEEIMVRFRDYEFFVPKDAAGREMIAEGYLFREIQSVGEQRHYAEDAGESEEEIALITEPIETYFFEAHGVLIKNKE